MRALLLLLACVFAWPFRAGAERVRLAGGGPPPTDCMLVTEAIGPASAVHGRRFSCTDGDAACDMDGRADGVCTLSLRICLDDSSHLDCGPDVITHVALRRPRPPLTALVNALHALTMPVETPDTCTQPVAVSIDTRGRRAARVALRATATARSGPADHDRLTVVCLRPSPVVSLATVQRRVFTPSCTSASCHGGARAGGLDLRPEATATSLIGILASNDAARAAGRLRVVPGAPDESFLFRKLTGLLDSEEGEAMPRSQMLLPAARIALVRQWIADLARSPVDSPSTGR